jgi:hypothetical protein
MSLSTNGAMALASNPSHNMLHVQKLSLQRVDVNLGHPKAVSVYVLFFYVNYSSVSFRS